MIRPAELSATGPLVAAASAALLLLAAWLLLRRRGGAPGDQPVLWPDRGVIFRETVIVKPPPPLAFIASIFLHLIVVSLIPYAGIVAPEIVIRASRSELVLIEYRLSQGTAIEAPRRTAPRREPQAAQVSVAVAKTPRKWRERKPVDRPTDLPEAAAEALRADVEVTRFDTVIQMFPPDAPEAPAVAETSDAPGFVLQWRPPRGRPGPEVLAKMAALDEIDALLDRIGALHEFNASERYELPSAPAGIFVNAALAEYGPPMAGLQVQVPGYPGPFGAPPVVEFVILRFDGHSGRSVDYQGSSLAPPRAPGRIDAGELDGVGRGIPANGHGETLDGSEQNPTGPLHRRRYGIILVGSGARGSIPAADGWLTGNPIYTVYLNVPGSVRRWILQFCRPDGKSRRLEISSGVIRLRQRRTLDPPFARRTQPVRLDPGVGGRWERAAVFARLDAAGAMSNLQIVSGPGGESGDRILASLRSWVFLPAFENGNPVAVEAMFSIPLN